MTWGPSISLIATKLNKYVNVGSKTNAEAGRERATSLGFPDAYAFTKAMASKPFKKFGNYSVIDSSPINN